MEDDTKTINVMEEDDNKTTIVKAPVKRTQGRRKIEIKKIDNVNHRHVAFSKRRLGLFNKASELCILCGSQIAAIVESYGGKRIFTFGHPSVDSVIDRYLSSNAPQHPPPPPLSAAAAHEDQYLQSCQELEAAKKVVEKLQVIDDDEKKRGKRGGGSDPYWWDLPIEKMSEKELKEYVAALEELKNKATLKVDELETMAMLMNTTDDYLPHLLPTYDDESAYRLGLDQFN